MERILGIAYKQYPKNEKNNKPFYELLVRRPIESVDAEGFKKNGVGFDTEIPYLKQPIKVDPAYAKQLIESGAFIPDRDYEFEMGSNPDDIYESWVSKLIPVDDEIKKHFDTSLKAK
ncbi:DUF1293 family protein [Vibrio harveyi]|uniref:DUF1293 family protein n=1 Tax=Vibrio harveyi TaxID=669 RepID=UPI00237FF1EB|nr:DUF1293 family protein [Vibrio harveyi]ELI6425912.1 DUF1293 family protein [Vibrio harveyi]